MNADSANARTRARNGEMPIDCAATSLPRTARSVRPTVPSRIWITASAVRTNTTMASTRNFLSSARSHGPIVGRGTRVPWRIDVSPPPTNGSRIITESKKYANASVAIATHTPPRRMIGSESSAPIAAASAAPITAARITDIPARSVSWNAANPPIAANVPWHSEIWPAIPVITVIDRKIVPRITAWVTMKSHESSARVNTTSAVRTTATTPKIRVASVSVRLRSSAASAGGGGSTPESGSAWSRAVRSAGHRTSSPNSTTNGIAGVTFSWIWPMSGWSADHRGRNVLASAMSTPRPIPPRNARGRLTSAPTAAAAIATTMRLKKSPAARVLKRGAMSTPANPANRLDSAQLNADTRSARMPASSVMRGLSTTARMRRPRSVNRNSAASAAVAVSAMAIATNSLRLKL